MSHHGGGHADPFMCLYIYTATGKAWTAITQASQKLSQEKWVWRGRGSSLRRIKSVICWRRQISVDFSDRKGGPASIFQAPSSDPGAGTLSVPNQLTQPLIRRMFALQLSSGHLVCGYFVSNQPGQRADDGAQRVEKEPRWGPQPLAVLVWQRHQLKEGEATGWSEGNRSSTRRFQMAVGKEAVGVFQSTGFISSLSLFLSPLLPAPRQQSISLTAKKASGGLGETEDGCPCGCLQDSAHEGCLGGAQGSLDQETSYLESL